MSSKVLIFGQELSSQNWEKIYAEKPLLKEEIAFYQDPVVPRVDCRDGTAYVDLRKEGFCSPEFLVELARSFEKLRIVGIADSPTEEETLRVAQLGVAEILNKEQYLTRIEAYIHQSEQKEKKEVKEEKTEKLLLPPLGTLDISTIIGHSRKMAEIKKMIEHLGDVDFPNAIIFGETGTGKDLLAKVLHYNGVRKDKNFIEVNCSAIPDELFESELFGHKKGAFTDAKTDKPGLFEFAIDGTIFLDEIGNLSLSAQAKLLKILENHKLRPLGGVEEKDINVRVLAATNINLEQAVYERRFREDLLFRLNLIAIHIPPLRDRKEDIADIAFHNFKFYRTLYNKLQLTISDPAIDVLQNHSWPGNVRELRSVIERAVLLATANQITPREMTDAIRNGRVTARERRKIMIEIPDQGITLKQIEKQVIGEILNMVGWNRTQAAQILGISRPRLRRIMEDNGLIENRRTPD
jgi:DNA-binding NtrC family response regulator